MKTCRDSADKRVMSDLAHSAMCAGIVAATAVLAAVAGLMMFWSYPGRPKPFVHEKGKPLTRELIRFAYAIDPMFGQTSTRAAMRNPSPSSTWGHSSARFGHLVCVNPEDARK